MLSRVTPLLGLFLFTTAAAAAEPPAVRESIEWLDVWVPGNEDTKRPKVLLIGDSITRSYHREVEALLKDKMTVCRLATSKSVGDPALLAEVRLVMSQTKFDAVHFNNGLHGWGYTEEQYAAAFPEFVKTIREAAPNAKLVWATTTPMRVGNKLGEFSDKTARVKARNAIAAKIVAAEKIDTDDLFAVVADKPEFYSGDGVHFNNKGTAALAAKVAEALTK